ILAEPCVQPCGHARIGRLAARCDEPSLYCPIRDLACRQRTSNGPQDLKRSLDVRHASLAPHRRSASVTVASGGRGLRSMPKTIIVQSSDDLAAWLTVAAMSHVAPRPGRRR